ncbi:MAG: glycerol kinase GlpK [Betaproteobacteria bacterium]|nr:glycerol kinase GlpK [Betaproteobacteria bacterium]
MPCLLALDQGTTSSRAIVFNEEGSPLGEARRELRQIYPQPGWVEHDPLEIWEGQLACARGALADAGIHPADVGAIGITNQRETTLLWERATGRPLANAIVWQDRRTADLCDRLRAGGREAEVHARTGLVLDPYFSATKLAWLLDHLPGARARAQRGELAFGTVDTWLIWQLTGGRQHLTDVTNASRTLLLDLARGDWDEDMLELFRIPRALLPRVVPSSGWLGHTLPEHFDGVALPIGGVAGDQQAALFGQACHAPGQAKNTYGTGCFLLMHTGATRRQSAHGLVATAAAQTGSQPAYALEGGVFVAGAAVQWLRDGLGLIRHSGEVEALAAQVPDSGGVVFVPAFTGLGAPHWDARARGTLLGLTRGSSGAHIARAALEAIAFQSAELAAAVAADSGTALEALRVDGGASANDLLMQFQADLLGVPVQRPRVQETTALGAAYLAGLAAGVWHHPAEIAAIWQIDREFLPRMSRDEARARMARWSEAVARSRGWDAGAPPAG